MGLKRSRSCGNHGESPRSLKRSRRAASYPVQDTTAPQTKPPCRSLSPKNERPYNARQNACSKDDHPVADTIKMRSSHKVGSCLPENLPNSVSSWIEDLPKAPIEFEDMEQVFERPQSASDNSLQSFDDASGYDSRRSRSDFYKDPWYVALLESKGAFMRKSEAGLLAEEIEYCKILLSTEDTVGMELKDSILDSDFLQEFITLMERSSKMRLYVHLHERLVPSAEILNLRRGKIGDLQEGCNDRWLQAIRFVSKIPQPDRTVGFRHSAFTDLEIQKLGIQPGVSSLYAACEGMLFPFFTCEVGDEEEGLTSAKRANAHNMAVALRGVVDLFRRASSEQDIHRKILGFTIEHDASMVHIYAHYPEIDGSKTAFYQHPLRKFSYGNRDGEDRYTSYKFVYNVYAKFAVRHLQRLKTAIEKLEIPRLETFTGVEEDANLVIPTTSEVETLTPSEEAQIAKLTQDLTEAKQREQEAKQREQEAIQREQEAIQREQEAKQRVQEAKQ